jgi:hypothetical protein
MQSVQSKCRVFECRVSAVCGYLVCGVLPKLSISKVFLHEFPDFWTNFSEAESVTTEIFHEFAIPDKTEMWLVPDEQH